MRRVAAAPLALSVALLTTPGAQAQESASACAPDAGRISAWNGIWIAENLQPDINGRSPVGGPSDVEAMKLIGLDAPWNAEGWTLWEAALGPDKTTHGWGYPVMMSAPSPFKFVITPDETVIVSQYREIRYVYTDGRQHPPEDELWPTVWGDSVGCWEGDTLAIDTIGIKYTPGFAYFSPPLSERARVVERLRMVSPDRLEADYIITDPERLTAPWTVRMAYLRHPVLDRLVHEGDVFENDRFVTGEDGMTIADVEAEPAAGPSFPETVTLSAAEQDRLVGTYALDGAPMQLTIERRGELMFARVDPAIPLLLPIRPTDPWTFLSRITGMRFRFLADAEGRVTGFEGNWPDGQAVSGKRKTD